MEDYKHGHIHRFQFIYI